MKKSINQVKSIVVLTGAGISAESGIKTFRDSDGLWENHRVEDVASPEGFERDPELVYRFYNDRRAQLLSDAVKENPAHDALAKLEKEFQGDFTLITQNIDNLHERAGSKNIMHMHGELLKMRCKKTGIIFETTESFDEKTECDCCHIAGNLRPHIVWFGEMPLFMREIEEKLESCDLFISIGTSGHVYPAAMFVQLVPKDSIRIEVNLTGTQISKHFDKHLTGQASVEVSDLVEQILSRKLKI